MFAELASETVPWETVVIYQVDERVAPADDPDRNLHHLREELGAAPARVVPMPVEDADLDSAAAAYGRPSPRISISSISGSVRTATPRRWFRPTRSCRCRPPGRPHPAVSGSGEDDLDLSALARARQILWLVTGADKQNALARLLAGDQGIPAGRVEADSSLVMADRHAV